MKPRDYGLTARSWPIFALLAAYLLGFVVVPVGKMLISGITNEDGDLAVGTLGIFLDNPLYIECLLNSVGVALGASVLAALAALPVAIALWRFRLQPPLILELFGFLPLFVPPFMLSLSLQSLLGRGGAIGMLMQPFGDFDPSRWGLPGVMVIEAIHYFPLVLMTLVLSTTAFSQQAEEAARLGNSWPRLISRVFLPLGLPGLAFGMAITFLKTLDDLATPLSLGVTNLLAPQAYFRVSTYGALDPLSSLMAVAMIAISVLVWLLSASFLQHGVYHWTGAPTTRAVQLTATERRAGALILAGIAGFYLLSYSGTILTSAAKIWSHTVLPESWVLSHYSSALKNETGSFVNTLIYCGIAAVLDVIIGLVMAYTIGRSPARWKIPLAWGAASLLSVPGVALAIAYLQFFQGMQLPILGKPLDATWFLLPMAFSVRGLPFAIRACSFALQNLPLSYVEAANLSGASRLSVLLRIILPMMAFGLLMAFLICFGIAAVDLSSAMLLVPSETDAPVSYSIYLHMQTSTGRGTGSALAMLTIGVVALCMSVLVLLIQRNWKPASSLRRILFQEPPRK